MISRPGKFHNRPKMHQIGKWDWELDEPLVYEDIEDEGVTIITVPAGFRSDLASIRSLRDIMRVCLVAVLLLWAMWCILHVLFAIDWYWLQWFALGYAVIGGAALIVYALLAGYAVRAAILHDYLYQTGLFPKRRSDRVFFRACYRGEGIARWRSALFWAGPAIAGGRHYHAAK